MKVFNLYNLQYSNKSEMIFLNLAKKEFSKLDLKCSRIKTETLWTLRYDNTKGIDRNMSKYLLFKLNESDLRHKQKGDLVLKPYETFTRQDDYHENFKILNTGGDVTAVDWLASKFIDKKHNVIRSNSFFDLSCQYFAYAIKPSAELKEIKLPDYEYSEEEEQKLKIESENCSQTECQPNLIYICRHNGLNFKYRNVADLFAIYNDKIGTVNCLKWRNDFGILYNYKQSEFLNFLGYLLAASSNGNGYIYLVHDLMNKPSTDNEDEYNVIVDIECYIPTFKIVLKREGFCGQCISADWLQSYGAIFVALGWNFFDFILFFKSLG